MTAPLLEVRGVRRSFGGREALLGVSLEVAAGEAVGIAGESGAGKSTLARILAGHDRPGAGEVRLEGSPLAKPDPRVQLIFQDPGLSLDPRLRVREAIAEGLVLQRVVPEHQVAEEVLRLLSVVGLPAELAGRFPHALSGGEKQRVAIARALGVRPRVLVADEPVAALDAVHKRNLLELLRRLVSELGLALVLISHDLAAVARFCDRVLILYGGAVVESLPSERLARDAAHPYTRALVAAVLPASPRGPS